MLLLLYKAGPITVQCNHNALALPAAAAVHMSSDYEFSYVSCVGRVPLVWLRENVCTCMASLLSVCVTSTRTMQ